MAGWSVEDNWNIPGVYFADEEAIVYDTATAFPPAPKRGGWAAKRAKEAAAAAAEEQVDNEV